MYVIFPFCTGVLRATASLSSYLFYWSPCVIILSSCVIILFVPNPGKWEGEASMSTCRTTFHLNTPEGSPWKDVTGRRNQTSMKGRDMATESDLSNPSHARRKPWKDVTLWRKHRKRRGRPGRKRVPRLWVRGLGTSLITRGMHAPQGPKRDACASHGRLGLLMWEKRYPSTKI